MEIIDEIRKKQDDLIVMINSTFDELVKKVSNLSEGVVVDSYSYETIYPLNNTSGFKGKKVISVIINDKRTIVPTWKVLALEIFKSVLEEDVFSERLYALRDKVLGRKRKRLSASDTDMRSPIKLSNNLYLESHYDTETLMNLVLQILNEIDFDYSNIKVVIKN